MSPGLYLFLGACALVLSGPNAAAEVRIVVERHSNEIAVEGFAFTNVPPPSMNDAASLAVWTLVDGRRDANGAGLDKLHDGQGPSEEDEPAANFFFSSGTDGGRICVDLGKPIQIRQVNTYSWHPGSRGPQVYRLYASDGQAAGFEAGPKRGIDPLGCGWLLLASVDTRPKTGEAGGQYGVSILGSDGSVGIYRYLLFDLSRTEQRDAFGNTFYSEIDVVDRDGPAPVTVPPLAERPGIQMVETDGGYYRISIDASETLDLADWVRDELAPMVREWYPKIVRLLPSEGFVAPQRVSIVIRKDMKGVADTSGARIRCSAQWIRQSLRGEAKGSVFHELVHVVQRYGRAPRGSARPPGWLTEGIADYLRWYHFEPRAGGAAISKAELAKARYDGSYRVTANFLNWVTEQHDKDLVRHLNAALREGRYDEELWKQRTGRTPPELEADWKRSLGQSLEAGTAPGPR